MLKTVKVNNFWQNMYGNRQKFQIFDNIILILESVWLISLMFGYEKEKI